MRHDHLKRELELMLMLSQNRQYGVEEVCKRLDISPRSFYYYINFFRDAGFVVEKRGHYYSLDRGSWFFKKLYDLVQLTEDEAMLMRQLIEKAGTDSPRLSSLHRKLDRFYDFKILEDEALQRRVTSIRGTIYEAIKHKMAVEIKGYSSPSSRSVSNRLVEPFHFMNNNRDVTCYEPASGKNKTFRLSRMEDAVMLEMPWRHEDRHRRPHIDLFSFSGEELTRVTVLMGQLSHNLMLEEYPASATVFTRQADGRWLFEADVCSYLGVGRFVLGLYDDVEVLGDKGFREYVAGKLRTWDDTLKK